MDEVSMMQFHGQIFRKLNFHSKAANEIQKEAVWVFGAEVSGDWKTNSGHSWILDALHIHYEFFASALLIKKNFLPVASAPSIGNPTMAQLLMNHNYVIE
jgi:hypothetical protein